MLILHVKLGDITREQYWFITESCPILCLKRKIQGKNVGALCNHESYE